MHKRSDKQLIADYLKGDEKSLEILIRQYLKPIYGFVYRYVGNSGDAEDITQDIFIKVWRNLKRFDKKKKFKTWVFSIAKNTSIDWLRKSRSASGGKKAIPFSNFFAQGGSAFGGENPFIRTLIDPAPLPDELSERRSVAQILQSAIEKLLPKYRLVLSLRYSDNLNFREIAERLKEPLDTVKSRHRRALIILKKLL